MVPRRRPSPPVRTGARRACALSARTRAATRSAMPNSPRGGARNCARPRQRRVARAGRCWCCSCPSARTHGKRATGSARCCGTATTRSSSTPPRACWRARPLRTCRPNSGPQPRPRRRRRARSRCWWSTCRRPRRPRRARSRASSPRCSSGRRCRRSRPRRTSRLARGTAATSRGSAIGARRACARCRRRCTRRHGSTASMRRPQRRRQSAR